MPDLTYWQLNDDVDPGAPLAQQAASIAIPTMFGNDIVNVPQQITISPAPKLEDDMLGRVIPGSRVIECAHPFLSNILQELPYTQIEKPAKKALEAQAKDAEGHLEHNAELRKLAGEQEDTTPLSGGVSVPADIPAPEADTTNIEPAAGGEEG